MSYQSYNEEKMKNILNSLNLLKPTGHVIYQQSATVRSAHTAFMCFVFI